MKYDLKQFTLEEKLRLLTGKDSWRLYDANGKLPEVFLADGPHGVRKVVDGQTLVATAMPNISALTNSWDPSLAYLDGETIGDECIARDVDVLLALGVNIKRTPLCGRNFEYSSEDPFLAGAMAKAYIEGVQSKGVGTSLKHFALNNREYERLAQSSEVDDRTFHEIYLPAFETVLEAKPWTVMCSYNPVNGIWASENEKLLKGVLRDELGYNGLIVSDWNAVHHSGKAAKATLDLRMPSTWDDTAVNELKEGLNEGWLTEEEIDERVCKVLELVEKKVNADKTKKSVKTKEENHAAAVKIAQDSIVLLKNEDDILPLKGGRIAIGGQFAAKPPFGGGGSALVNSDYAPRNLAEELSERLGDGATVEFIRDYSDTVHQARIRHTSSLLSAAYEADTVVLCVGSNAQMDGEDFDRTTIRLSPVHEDIILNTAKYNKNVVVVIYGGGAVDMRAWIGQVKAVVFAGFLGEGGQEAVADVLSGKVNPSGKLSETFPLCLEDTPTGADTGNGFVERYAEGVLVGYRWYDTKGKDVLFPFGHGLSYADFEYSDLAIEKKSETDYEVSFTVKNVSAVDGKEISQVYVRDVMATVERPEKELKGFAKTTLKAGESKRVCIALNARSFAFWSPALEKWYVESGAFDIYVGASSRDIRLCGKIEIDLPKKDQYCKAFKA